MLLRSVHTTIVNEMGWPSWISYIIFAGTTIVMGALLGLVSVQNTIKLSAWIVNQRLAMRHSVWKIFVMDLVRSYIILLGPAIRDKIRD